MHNRRSAITLMMEVTMQSTHITVTGDGTLPTVWGDGPVENCITWTPYRLHLVFAMHCPWADMRADGLTGNPSHGPDMWPGDIGHELAKRYTSDGRYRGTGQVIASNP